MSEIRVQRSETGVATLTIDRPHRKNAVPPSGWSELRRLFEEVAHDAGTRVLVVTGAGRAFCTGADLAESAPRQHPLQSMIPVNAAALALHELPKPTIAMVNGDAVGAGMNLALGCDLVVAGESARFSQIFVRRGLSLDFGGSWLLPRLVGMHKAKELALFGDILSAREALELGLVNRVVPDAGLGAFVQEWAERLASGPPLALQLNKKLLSNALHTGLAEALDAEAAAQGVNLLSEDVREGITAFLEKRSPTFHGR
ncbi:2-(1,2-epoxy-1,2-dihydrophenyl)acetyl-CoA isomerase [Myxococcaceae bacterium]|nr:2-(1,2-epoxy-1,2-dihydrophenyl)acetyl-CoA isomerase [Myxococcaceae bacterium]